MDISDPTLSPVERDIATRLRPICADMPLEVFLALVRDIARVEAKYRPKSDAE